MITKALKNTMDFEKFLETKHLWDNPPFNEWERVHCWRNYISQDMAKIWNTFTDLQKFYIYENADYAASKEDWE